MIKSINEPRITLLIHIKPNYKLHSISPVQFNLSTIQAVLSVQTLFL